MGGTAVEGLERRMELIYFGNLFGLCLTVMFVLVVFFMLIVRAANSLILLDLHDEMSECWRVRSFSLIPGKPNH